MMNRVCERSHRLSPACASLPEGAWGVPRRTSGEASVPANPFEGMEPEAMLRALKEKALQLESDAARIREELAASSASASSPDGAVTVTLSPTGALQDITFGAKAVSHKPEALGPLVMRTVEAAQQAVATRVAGTVTEPAAAEYLRGLLPAPAKPQPTRAPDDDEGSLLRRRTGGRP
jgi:DNA-binding protein YbaB